MKLMAVFRPVVDQAADSIYRAIVEQSRQPAFYIECGVPDTPDGRFDMITAHLVLVLRQLRRNHPEKKDLAQALFDLTFADFDQNLREMGVGDLAVGKRVKAMARAFYGRLAVYDSALSDSNDIALQLALRRNLFRKASPTPKQVTAMSAYLLREAARLRDEGRDLVVAGRLSFGPVPNTSPCPESFDD